MTSRPRIGYVPYSADLKSPGDRRRFPGYAARRKIDFELANPGERYDIVVLSETADITAWIEYRSGKLVYDLIDSYLAVPRSNIKQLLRGPAKYFAGQFKHLRLDYKGAVRAMCRRADAVVCTTEEQKAEIGRLCGNVHVVLDFHSTVARTNKLDYRSHSPVRIAWEGFGINVRQLTLISDVLRALTDNIDITLVLVTDRVSYRWMNRIGRIDTLRVAQKILPAVEVHPWSEDTCADLLCECDIAVIPLDLSDPFVAGKPENKLLLLWRMGIPVIASATPAYSRAMEAAGTRHLACKTKGDWLSALKTLTADERARYTAGKLGREFVRSSWSEEALLARWDRAMQSVGLSLPD